MYRYGPYGQTAAGACLAIAGPELYIELHLLQVYLVQQGLGGGVRRGGGRVALYSAPVEYKGRYRDHKKEGPWTVEELIKMVPKTIMTQ